MISPENPWITRTEAAPEETEDLTVRRLPLAEAIAMVRRGEITDSISVIALLALAAEPSWLSFR